MIVIVSWYYESGVHLSQRTIRFIINLPSGHIGYDSQMCGQSYLECPKFINDQNHRDTTVSDSI